MTEKEWQRIKLHDVAWVVIGSIGTLLVIALICILSSMGWFYQLSVSGVLSFLDEGLVTVLIGGVLLIPFLSLTATGCVLVWHDLCIERKCRKKPPELHIHLMTGILWKAILVTMALSSSLHPRGLACSRQVP